MERIKTGIDGLNDLIQGGFPVKSCTLISGAPGTGKTIFGLQTLVGNARNGKVGIFVTLGETRDEILKHGKAFNCNIKEMKSKGKLILLEYLTLEREDYEKEIERMKKEKKEHEKLAKKEPGAYKPNIEFYTGKIEKLERMIEERVGIYSQEERKNKLISQLTKLIPKIKAEILVIDSLSQFMLYEESRPALSEFIQDINKLGVTVILISEAPPEGIDSLERVAEYEVDGVIKLEHITGSTSNRTLVVEKMRETKIDDRVHPMEITDHGLAVQKAEELYK